MKMKYFAFLALLPYIFAAEIQKAVCVDGTQCPEGNYCCELPSGKPGCCEITKEWKDKGVVPALPPLEKETVSRTQSKAMSDLCDGTSCGIHCFPNIYGATCCGNPQYACPRSTKCCSNDYNEQPWCCKSNQRCYSIRGLCINGAVTTSTAMMSVLFAFMIGVVSKYFL